MLQTLAKMGDAQESKYGKSFWVMRAREEEYAV